MLIKIPDIITSSIITSLKGSKKNKRKVHKEIEEAKTKLENLNNRSDEIINLWVGLRKSFIGAGPVKIKKGTIANYITKNYNPIKKQRDIINDFETLFDETEKSLSPYKNNKDAKSILEEIKQALNRNKAFLNKRLKVLNSVIRSSWNVLWELNTKEDLLNLARKERGKVAAKKMENSKHSKRHGEYFTIRDLVEDTIRRGLKEFQTIHPEAKWEPTNKKYNPDSVNFIMDDIGPGVKFASVLEYKNLPKAGGGLVPETFVILTQVMKDLKTVKEVGRTQSRKDVLKNLKKQRTKVFLSVDVVQPTNPSKIKGKPIIGRDSAENALNYYFVRNNIGIWPVKIISPKDGREIKLDKKRVERLLDNNKKRVAKGGPSYFNLVTQPKEVNFDKANSEIVITIPKARILKRDDYKDCFADKNYLSKNPGCVNQLSKDLMMDIAVLMDKRKPRFARTKKQKKKTEASIISKSILEEFNAEKKSKLRKRTKPLEVDETPKKKLTKKQKRIKFLEEREKYNKKKEYEKRKKLQKELHITETENQIQFIDIKDKEKSIVVKFKITPAVPKDEPEMTEEEHERYEEKQKKKTKEEKKKAKAEKRKKARKKEVWEDPEEISYEDIKDMSNKEYNKFITDNPVFFDVTKKLRQEDKEKEEEEKELERESVSELDPEKDLTN